MNLQINYSQSSARRPACMVLRKLKFDPITDDLRDQLPSYADGLEASAASNPSTNPVQTWCSCLQVPTCMLLLHMISPVGNGSQRLRSATHGNLAVPRTRTGRMGPRSFAVSGPTLYGTRCR